MRYRLLYLGVAVSVVPVGLISRSLRSGSVPSSPVGFIAAYLPDTVWATMFFFLFAAVLVRWRTWSLAALTLAFTFTIEAAQLYQGEPLDTLRSIPWIHFLLGTKFLWTDLVCLCVGTTMAAALHHLIRSKQTI
ncbi:MAG: DUF2809 domain-containing protein [Phycisphaeraceae bacterium]